MDDLRLRQMEFVNSLSKIYASGEAEAMYREISLEYGIHPTRNKISKEEISSFLERLDVIQQELQSHKPLQYILGKAWFYGLELHVNESVLIPRPETEELVDQVLKSQRTFPHILDIGTGSGCIAISLKKHLKDSEVTAIDLSKSALETSKENANKHHLEIDFVQADILEWNYFMDPEKKFDLIISNPPYIRPSEKIDMHKNVLEYEPENALFVEEESPLIFYQVISELAYKHLNTGGMLAFEINQYLGDETVKLIQSKGFTKIEKHQDMYGNDRMIFAFR